MISYKVIKPHVTNFIHSYLPKEEGKIVAERISKSKYFFEILKSRKFYYVDYLNKDENIFNNYNQEPIIFFNNYIPKTYKNFLSFSSFFVNLANKKHNVKFIFFFSNLSWEQYQKEILKLNFYFQYESKVSFKNNFATKTLEGFFKIYFRRESEFISDDPVRNGHKIYAWDYSSMCWKDAHILTTQFLHIDKTRDFNIAIGGLFEFIFNYLTKNEEK